MFKVRGLRWPLAMLAFLCLGLAGSRPALAQWTLADVAVSGTDSKPRLLWAKTTGTGTQAVGAASLWTLADDGVTFEEGYEHFQDEPGWTPRRIGVGRDEKPRVLWTHNDGRASLWTMTEDGSTVDDEVEHGPFPGWTPTGLQVTITNRVYLLWTHTSGSVSVWRLSSSGKFNAGAEYFREGWTATLGKGVGTKPRLLWTRNDGAAQVVGLTSDAEEVENEGEVYGPFPGWSAIAVATTAPEDAPIPGDNTQRLLWRNSNGAASVWHLDSSGKLLEVLGRPDAVEYGPFPGWQPETIAVGGNNRPYLLWTNVDRRASLWSLEQDTGNFRNGMEWGPFQ